MAAHVIVDVALGRFRQQAGGEVTAGEAVVIDELEIEVQRAVVLRGQDFVGVVERRVGTRLARAGVKFRLRHEGVESCLVRLEGLRGGAEPENFHLHGVALLDFRQHVQAADDVAEDGVLVIEPLLRAEHEAVLRAVGIRAAVGHLQDARRIMPQAGHDFIGKRIADARRRRRPARRSPRRRDAISARRNKACRDWGPSVPSARPT